MSAHSWQQASIPLRRLRCPSHLCNPPSVSTRAFPAGSFKAARERMLAVASAAGDVLPCLFLQANDNDATPQLVSLTVLRARLPG